MFQKSFIILSCFVLLNGCAQINPQLVQVSNIKTDTKIDVKTDIKTCLLREAQSCIQDGSAFASPVRTTAKKIATVCVNEVIPTSEQTENTSSETRQMAQTILTTLIGQENE